MKRIITVSHLYVSLPNPLWILFQVCFQQEDRSESRMFSTRKITNYDIDQVDSNQVQTDRTKQGITDSKSCSLERTILSPGLSTH